MPKYLTVGELRDLENTQSAAEWNILCDKIKSARGGSYPTNWYQEVILSGLIGIKHLEFGGII